MAATWVPNAHRLGRMIQLASSIPRVRSQMKLGSEGLHVSVLLPGKGWVVVIANETPPQARERPLGPTS
jgi:hypothetical protein